MPKTAPKYQFRSRELAEDAWRRRDRDATLLQQALSAALHNKIVWRERRVPGGLYRLGLIDPLQSHGGITVLQWSGDMNGGSIHVSASYLDDLHGVLVRRHTFNPKDAEARALYELVVELRGIRDAQERRSEP